MDKKAQVLNEKLNARRRDEARERRRALLAFRRRVYTPWNKRRGDTRAAAVFSAVHFAVGKN